MALDYVENHVNPGRLAPCLATGVVECGRLDGRLEVAAAAPGAHFVVSPEHGVDLAAADGEVQIWLGSSRGGVEGEIARGCGVSRRKWPGRFGW